MDSETKRIHCDTPVSELIYDSDNDPNDELYHWGWKKKDHKYIKRERVNGKWVYTYPEDLKGDKDNKSSVLDTVANALGLNVRKSYKTAKKTYKTARKMVSKRNEAYNEVRDKAYKDNKITKKERRKIRSARFKLANAKLAKEISGKQFVKTKSAYFKTPIGKLSSFVDKGSKWMKRITGKIIDISNKDANKRNDAAIEERARKTRGDYAEAQTKERNEVRAPELKKLLEKLNEPSKWYKKSERLPGLKLKTKATTLDEDMALVNPNYDKNNPNDKWDENCSSCTIAYDLRRRGYDVESLPENKVTMTVSQLTDIYDGGKLVSDADVRKKYDIKGSTTKIAKQMTKDIAKHGDGARGNMSFKWKAGGGHIIAWEVVDGRVEYRDAQTNKKINLEDYAARSENMWYMRTDNVTPTEECLAFVRSRKERRGE